MTCLILPNTSHIKRYFAYTVSDQDCVLSQTSQSCLVPSPYSALGSDPGAASSSTHQSHGHKSLAMCTRASLGVRVMGLLCSLYPQPKWWLSSSNYQEGKLSQRDNLLQVRAKDRVSRYCAHPSSISQASLRFQPNSPKSINTQVCVTCELCLRLYRPGNLG